MVLDRRILIDGFAWPPDAFLERLRSPELPSEEFWRCMSYALFVMQDDKKYVEALNEVKRERTHTYFPPQEATTPQNEMPDAPPRMAPPVVRTPKIFHDNLDDQEIATTLLRTDRLGLGPKQFALAVQDFFSSIGWMVNTIDTQFVTWMKVHELMQSAAKDLQHVSWVDKMDDLKDNLKNTFMFQNRIGEWEDRREYYKRNDSQKINGGKKRQ